MCFLLYCDQVLLLLVVILFLILVWNNVVLSSRWLLKICYLVFSLLDFVFCGLKLVWLVLLLLLLVVRVKLLFFGGCCEMVQLMQILFCLVKWYSVLVFQLIRLLDLVVLIVVIGLLVDCLGGQVIVLCLLLLQVVVLLYLVW